MPNLEKDLHTALTRSFDLEGLRGLCYQVGINHENFEAKGLRGVALELILSCEREGKVEELRDAIIKERPDLAERLRVPSRVRADSLNPFYTGVGVGIVVLGNVLWSTSMLWLWYEASFRVLAGFLICFALAFISNFLTLPQLPSRNVLLERLVRLGRYITRASFLLLTATIIYLSCLSYFTLRLRSIQLASLVFLLAVVITFLRSRRDSLTPFTFSLNLDGGTRVVFWYFLPLVFLVCVLVAYVEGRVNEYIVKGNLFNYSGDWVQGESLFRSALELAPRSSPAYAGLAHSLKATGYSLEAITAYEQAIRYSPREPIYYHNLAALYLTLGYPEGSLASLQQAASMSDCGGDRREMCILIYNNLADTYIKLERWSEAREILMRGFTLKPSEMEAAFLHKHLGHVALEQGKLEEAFRELEIARVHQATHVKATYLLALTYLERAQAGDKERACLLLYEIVNDLDRGLSAKVLIEESCPLSHQP